MKGSQAFFGFVDSISSKSGHRSASETRIGTHRVSVATRIRPLTRRDLLQPGSYQVADLLRKVDMDLIVEVDMERRYSHSRYETRNEDGLGFIPNSARLFIIKSDGKLLTI